MERQIGVCKGFVSLMSDIDTHVQNRILQSESLNHMPRLQELNLELDVDVLDVIPFYKQRKAILSRKGVYPSLSIPGNRVELIAKMVGLIQTVFADDIEQYPAEKQYVHFFHPRFGLSIGSEASQGIWASNRRDDSYVYYLNNIGQGHLVYGRVIVYFYFHTWTSPMAFVKPQKSKTTQKTKLPYATGELGGLELIRADRIKTIVGRIRVPTSRSQRIYFVKDVLHDHIV